MTQYTVGSIGFAYLKRHFRRGRASLRLTPYNVYGEERITLLRLARYTRELPVWLRLVFCDPNGPLREITPDDVAWETLRGPDLDDEVTTLRAEVARLTELVDIYRDTHPAPASGWLAAVLADAKLAKGALR